MIHFTLDENLPAQAVDTLRKAGHDVRTVLEQGLGGAADRAIFEACAAPDVERERLLGDPRG